MAINASMPGFLETLHRMQQEARFCDLELFSRDTGAFSRVHRIVLIVRASQQGKDPITLPINRLDVGDGVSQTLLDLLILHLYTESQVHFQVGEVNQVVELAKRLQLPRLLDRAFEFMSRNLCADNCLEFLSVAISLDKPQMIENCLIFIRLQPQQFLENEKISCLDDAMVRNIVDDDQLPLVEDDVFHFVEKWRQMTLPDPGLMKSLYQGIRTHLLSDSVLGEIIRSDHFRNQFPWMMEDALAKFKEAPKKGFHRTKGSHYVALISPDNQLDAFDLRYNAFLRGRIKQAHQPLMLQECTRLSTSAALLVHDEILYVVGGFTDRKSVYKYDCRTASWTDGPPMRNARWGHAVCVVNDTLYVAGGCVQANDLKSAQTSCEMLSLKREGAQWVPFVPMNESRSMFGLAGLAFADRTTRIVAFGGRKSGQTSVECSVLPGKPWTALPEMLDSMEYGTHCVWQNKLFVFMSNKRGLCFDPATDKWAFLSPCPRIPTDPLIRVDADQFLTMCWEDGKISPKTYNPLDDSWCLDLDNEPLASKVQPNFVLKLPFSY
ncbi:Kelch-like protein 12 [Cichlidogyrus casuarinus]|uniref:Kelch-like protein 12 n=1 Tax=Cichlidogyrus casuarinus TaxID=1844966 RepID=A0ABD2QP01_9PLAT